VRRRLLFVLAACAALLVIGAPSASADDCKARVNSFKDLMNAENIQDCFRTGAGIGRVVAIILGGAGVTIAVAGLPGAGSTTKPPTEKPPGKEFEPKDRDECGSELYEIDNQLNGVLNQMRSVVDARSSVRMSKLDFEIKAAEARIKAAEIRSQVATYQANVTAAGVNMLLGTGFWTSAGILLAATGATLGIVAAWGIRAWRGYGLAQKVYNNYQGYDAGYGIRIPYSDIPRLKQFALDAAAFSDSVAEGIDLAAKQYDDELSQRKGEIDALRAKADEVYAHRERIYQGCLSKGHLPEGTWHRPPPDYTIDEEGTIIGVN